MDLLPLLAGLPFFSSRFFSSSFSCSFFPFFFPVRVKGEKIDEVRCSCTASPWAPGTTSVACDDVLVGGSTPKSKQLHVKRRNQIAGDGNSDI
ncbi:hypothetical protein VNO77_03775 [Canavalia gladiata]|uniref:Uncharacterized protein n=1 Tax=Canavalia gladiata TaxID=3824 RepID=A0AAN9R484_CANGL